MLKCSNIRLNLTCFAKEKDEKLLALERRVDDLKKWLILLAAAVTFLLLVLAGFNILVDPFGVFGDEIYHWDSYNFTNNPKTAKIEYLKEHKTEFGFLCDRLRHPPPHMTPKSLMNTWMHISITCAANDSSNKYYRDLADYLIANYEVKNILLNVGISEADFFNKTCEKQPLHAGAL